MARAATIALFLLAAACGGLATPDLRTGVVVGRITGASPAGYVYPLGRPDLKVPLAADGTFRLTAPSGTQSLVVYDGTFQTDPTTGAVIRYGRAARIDVQVAGADVKDLGDRPAATLPDAGAVLAGVRAESGALTKDPRFHVLGTDQDVVATGATPAAYLVPLPPGDYSLVVSMGGFKTATIPIAVASAATMPYESEILVDEAAEVKGCVATAGCDSAGLECHSDDGRCYENAAGSVKCGAACDPSIAGSCGAGLDCQTDGTGASSCTAPQGCPTFLAVVGSSCVADDACRSALVSGVCQKADDYTAGICTAPCTDSTQCAAFGASPSCSSGLCTR